MMKIYDPYRLSKTGINWLQKTYKKLEKGCHQLVSHNQINLKLKTLL